MVNQVKCECGCSEFKPRIHDAEEDIKFVCTKCGKERTLADGED